MKISPFALSITLVSLAACLPVFAGDLNQQTVKPIVAQATVDSAPTDGGMIITTTDLLDGYRVREYRGIVRGVMVREPNTIQQFKAGFQGMFGGKVNSYIRNCETGRKAAYDAMVQQAQAKGANGIIGVKYDSDAFQGGANDFGTEIVCYGTAVVVEQIKPQQ